MIGHSLRCHFFSCSWQGCKLPQILLRCKLHHILLQCSLLSVHIYLLSTCIYSSDFVYIPFIPMHILLLTVDIIPSHCYIDRLIDRLEFGRRETNTRSRSSANGIQLCDLCQWPVPVPRGTRRPCSHLLPSHRWC